MKIIIETNPKEIADLISAIQGQQSVESGKIIDGVINEIIKSEKLFP